MSETRIVLNREGINALLHADELERGLSELVSGIAGRCGDGYESDTRQMPSRVIASVYTDSARARQDNQKNNTILRSLP